MSGKLKSDEIRINILLSLLAEEAERLKKIRESKQEEENDNT